MIGKKYGRLVVISFSHRNARSKIFFNCQCDCGNVKIIEGDPLRRGATKSCGCYHKKANMKHGLASGGEKHRLYKIYGGMKDRCCNGKNHKYFRYGGRGIQICNEWLNDNSSFFNWAFANGYKKDLTIERIDNDGDYCPSNCKWATPKEQANNRSHIPKYLYKGKTYTGAQIETTFGVKSYLFRQRINRGWPIEKAINLPSDRTPRVSA